MIIMGLNPNREEQFDAVGRRHGRMRGYGIVIWRKGDSEILKKQMVDSNQHGA